MEQVRDKTDTVSLSICEREKFGASQTHETLAERFWYHKQWLLDQTKILSLSLSLQGKVMDFLGKRTTWATRTAIGH
jgi:hypothetical protein